MEVDEQVEHNAQILDANGKAVLVWPAQVAHA